VNHGTAGFGERGIEQVGAHRGGRVDAEQQHQQGRHQRAAADAGEPDDRANCKARVVLRVDRGRGWWWRRCSLGAGDGLVPQAFLFLFDQLRDASFAIQGLGLFRLAHGIGLDRCP
jgi:hypothetical protein